MRLIRALQRSNPGRPPVWFMRQAGRYHSHYQGLRRRHSFLEICRTPELACEAALGPVRDFGFDGAILFSDILFTLEAMGMTLEFPDSGPKLMGALQAALDPEKAAGRLAFQGEALRLTRRALPAEVALLGFAGGPFTLFCYAEDGSHKGGVPRARDGIQKGSGKFRVFADVAVELLARQLAIQAAAGANAVAVLDTCAGELSSEEFAREVAPSVNVLLARLQELCPGLPVIYYSRGTGPQHWAAIQGAPQGAFGAPPALGIDWRQDLGAALRAAAHGGGAIQGNVDPSWLLLDSAELEQKLRGYFESVRALPAELLRGWVCGLGHGVLPATPESNVRLFLRLQREYFQEGP